MDILVVGGGGREHTLVKKLSESSNCGRLYAAPGNGGIASIAKCVDLKATDLEGIGEFVKQNAIDYVVVAPDDPLVLGMVDRLAEMGIPAFGPSKAAAQLEGSKVFSKAFMKRNNIPTAAYESFDSAPAAIEYLESLADFPVVVKADGLALGKGVIIAQSLTEAKDAVLSMMEDKRFGDSGSRVVIEEFLTGPEVSVLAFADGDTVVPMVSSMDHKRAFTGDLGPNTGGMGTIAPNPHYTPEIAAECMEKIFLPTINCMKAEGAPFSGCLYFGLMLTPKGPMVIEYNCRFGDPETQVVIPLLKSDLLDIMLACTNGGLKPEMVEFSDGAAVCVVIASGGYPGDYKTGYEILGIEQAEEDSNIFVYHAGTKLGANAEPLSAGGRVLGVTATAKDLAAAQFAAYAAAAKISFEDSYYREDIGGKR